MDIYNPAAPAWSAAGSLSMAAGRVQHTSTLLPDGSVLIAGGNLAGAALNSVESIDPQTGAGSPCGALSTARFGHTASLLNDGTVLVTGGSNGTAMSSCEIYSPAARTWTAAGSLNIPRTYHTATLLSSGSVLVAGGENDNGDYLNSAELYDPVSRLWTKVANFTTPRELHSATLLPTGKVLIAGGFNGGYLLSAELYDPLTQSWGSAASLQMARSSHSATLMNDGRLLVAGGNNFGAIVRAEFYDPISNTWSFAASMLAARGDHRAVKLPSGRILVEGGTGAAGTPVQSAEAYDPNSRTWLAAGSMTVARQKHSATLLLDGRVLVVGGADAPVEASDDGLRYDASRRPALDPIGAPLILSNGFALTGMLFNGGVEGSNGMTNSSSANPPLVQIRNLSSGQSLWFFMDPAKTWSDASYNALSISATFPPGYAAVTVFSNAIPSVSAVARVLLLSNTASSDLQQNYSVSAQSVSLSATVNASDGNLANSGMVTFQLTSGGQNIGQAVVSAVSNGTATGTYSLPAGSPAGMYTIMASYSGSDSLAASSDAAHALSIVPAATNILASDATVSYTANSQSVVLEAVVSSDAGLVNEGNVTFLLQNGGMSVGVATVSTGVTDGAASVAYSLPAGTVPGVYTIVSSFGNSGNLTSSSDSAHTLTLTLAEAQASLSVASINATYAPGDVAFLLAADVSYAGGQVNEGTLTFQLLSNGMPAGPPVNASVINGHAEVNSPLQPLPAGMYGIQAIYSGSTNFAVAQPGAGTLAIAKAATTIASANQSGFSGIEQSIHLIASVQSDAGTVSEGEVSFQILQNGIAVGTAVSSTVATNGQAAADYILPAGLAPGTYTILAHFGNSVGFADSDDATHSVTLSGPAIASLPTASPNPAAVNESVAFSVAAIDNSALTYSWDFGDGSMSTGANVTHPYAEVGTYTATVTVTDALTASNSASVTVVVLPARYGSGPDTDMDGYSDSFETGAGSDPLDDASTPFGTGVQSVPIPTLLDASAPSIRLNFKQPNDSISLKGIVPLPGTFTLSGQVVIVQVGGYVHRFTLDSKGHSIAPDKSVFTLGVARKGLSRFSLSLKKASLAPDFKDDGLTPMAGPETVVNLTVTLLLNASAYRNNFALQYTVKGTAGSTRPLRK